MPTTIEQLELEVQSSSSSAVSGIDALSASLAKLKAATKGGVGLTTVANQLQRFNTALSGMDSSAPSKINALTSSLEKLKNLGGVKLSSSFANQISAIGQSAASIANTDFSGISRLTQVLEPLASFKATGFTSAISALNRLPKVAKTLNSMDLNKFTGQIQQLSNALAPLANQLNTVTTAFTRLPTNIRRVVTATNSLTQTNSRASTSYINLWAKLRMARVAIQMIGNTIASWLHTSNQYIEDMNLFNVALGEYASEAQKYAEQVGEVLGIDPGEFMRNQGTFNTIISGFGVASDKAYLMSKNLTQLGYDLSSFFNITVDDAMQKVQSGIAGELEPLRRLGYDLSVARLQEEALALGIEKKVSAMTQAEKSQLRYYAIMTQVTTAQGDMARTLNAPANQLRVLQAQVTQCARAIGNLFIPMLNAILPPVIAVVKVLRSLIVTIAGLFGINADRFGDMFSDVSSSVGSTASGLEDVSDGLGDATKAAKKLKNAMIGIDELNIISPNDDSSSGSGSGSGAGIGGSDLGIDLPTYDFLGNAVSSKIDAIVDKLKEWLGLNEEINSLSDLLHTRLGRILTTVGAIALGLAAWKISKGVLSALEYMQNLKKLGLGNAFTITVGISLLVTGVALEWAGIIDAIKYELNKMNFAQIIAGGLLTIGGSSIFGKGIASWIMSSFADSSIAAALTTAASNLGLGTATAAGAAIGAGIGGIIAGIPAYFTGIYDALKNGLNWLNGLLIPAGSTAAAAGIGAIIGACGGPIGAGIGALIGLAVGLVTDGIIAIKEHWGEITTFLNKFFTITVPGMWNKFKAWVQKLPSKVSEFFSNLWKPIENYDWYGLGKNIGTWFGNAVKSGIELVTVKIPNWFSSTWEAVKKTFSTFFTQTLPKFFTQTVPELWNTISEAFVTFFTETLPEKLSDIGTWFHDVGKAVWDGIVEGWNAGIKAIGDFIKGFVDGVKEALGIHSPSTVFAEIGSNIVAGLLQGIKTYTNVLNAVSEWAGKIVEWFVRGEDGVGIVERFAQIGNDIIAGFKNKVGSTYGTVKTNIITWATNVKNWFTSGSFGGVNSTNFQTFAGNIIEGFRTKVGSAYISTKSNMVTWATNVKEWFTNSSFGGVNSANFQTFANNVVTGFKDKIGSAYVNTKSNMTTWATNVKNWFSAIASTSAFSGFATSVIDGFKNRIGSYYTAAQSSMSTFGSNVKSWFTEHCSYDSFYNVASDVVNGFKNGIGALYNTCKNTISHWGGSIIDWFKDKLDVNSPSKVFYEIGGFAVEGFNNAITQMGKSTKVVVGTWADSFTDLRPTMALAVDTSALKYYTGGSFAKSVSANVALDSNYGVENSFSKEEFKEAMLLALKESGLVDDVRRQADKNEQTIVKIGNRTVTDAVTTQKKANGYTFVK